MSIIILCANSYVAEDAHYKKPAMSVITLLRGLFLIEKESVVKGGRELKTLRIRWRSSGDLVASCFLLLQRNKIIGIDATIRGTRPKCAF